MFALTHVHMFSVLPPSPQVGHDDSDEDAAPAADCLCLRLHSACGSGDEDQAGQLSIRSSAAELEITAMALWKLVLQGISYNVLYMHVHVHTCTM